MLRLLPRRSKLAKLPLLRSIGRARFLWSFQLQEAVPGFLIGWVLALGPFFGLHTPLAIICAILCRANLPIPLILLLFSNPLTLPFLWPMLHSIGNRVIHLLAATASHEAQGRAVGIGIHAVATMTLGSLLVGYACAAISIAVYATFFYIFRLKKRPNWPLLDDRGGDDRGNFSSQKNDGS
jgi:uncharacterized protein (DUF2062 family)